MAGRYALASLAVFGASASAGFAAPSGRASALPNAAREAAQEAAPPTHKDDLHVYCDGAQSPLSIDVQVARSIASGSGQQLELDVSVLSRFEHGARLAYSVEWLDDLGNEVTPTAAPRVTTVVARQGAKETQRTPAGLGDGYYQVRVKAAGVSDSGQTIGADATFYFRVDGGATLPLDDEQYRTFSRASLGVKP